MLISITKNRQNLGSIWTARSKHNAKDRLNMCLKVEGLTPLSEGSHIRSHRDQKQSCNALTALFPNTSLPQLPSDSISSHPGWTTGHMDIHQKALWVRTLKSNLVYQMISLNDGSYCMVGYYTADPLLILMLFQKINASKSFIFSVRHKSRCLAECPS